MAQKESDPPSKTPPAERLIAPTDEQRFRRLLLPYANPDSPIATQQEDEYQGPRIELIQREFPRQIEMGSVYIWVWVRDFDWLRRPTEVKEACDAYFAAGGQDYGPDWWYEDVLEAKRGSPRRFSPFTTLHFPVDLFVSIDEQAAEMKQVCEKAKRKLIEVSKVKPPRKGFVHEKQLARNILLVVLRDWSGEEMSSIADRLSESASEHSSRRMAVRLNSTRKILRTCSPKYTDGPFLLKRRLQK